MERTKTHESLYASSLIEASLDPLVTISTEGKVTDINQASVNITGVERNKLIGSDFFNYFTEPQKAREVYQKVFAKGYVVDSPLTLRHKNGKLTDVLFNGSVYKDVKENVLGVVIVARDITERKRALEEIKKLNETLEQKVIERTAQLEVANKELLIQNDEKEKRAMELIIAREKEKQFAELTIIKETLIASESRYRRLFETAKDGILILDAETGMIVDVNPFLIDLLGYSKEQFLEKEIWEIGFLKDIIANHEKFLELQQKKYVRYEDLPLKTAKGKQINVEFVSNVYLVDHQKVIQCNIRDITERKLAEKAIQQSENKFRLLAESMPQIVWITRPDGWNIYFNQQWVDYTGLTLEESYGHGWNKPFHPDDQQSAWEAWQKAIQNNGTYSIESRIRRSDGIYKWWLVRGVPVLDEHGTILNWFGTCTDIHEFKMAEIALRESEFSLKNAQAVAKIGSWETNLFNLSVIWSEELYRIFEIDKDVFEASHQAFLSFVHPDDRTIVDDAFESSLEKHSFNIIDHKIITPSGLVKFVEERWQVVFDDNGKPLKAVGTCQDISERKLAEIAVIESEKKFQLVVKATNDIIYDCDLLTGNCTWSEGLHKILGYPSELKTTDFQWWRDNIHPDDIGPLNKSVQKVCDENGENWVGEYRFKCFDGSYAVVFDRGFMKYDENKKLIRLTGSVMDISERKLAEIAVRESEEKFRSYIENMPDGIFVADENGKYLEVNKAACQITGYSETELLNMTVLNITPPDSLEEAGNQFLKVMSTGSGKCELNYRHKNGTNRMWSIDGVKLSETRILGFVKDITERKQTEEIIRESEERFRNLVETTNDIIWETDKEGSFTYISPKVKDILDYTPEELIGQLPFKLMPPNEAEKIKNRSDEIIASKKPFVNLININLHRNGDPVVFETSGVPILDKNNDLIGYRGIDRDITERKHAEDLLQINYSIQSTLNLILQLSIANIPLIELLKQTLDKVLDIPNLNFESKGSIFLLNKDTLELEMVVENNLSEPLKIACKSVPLGFCHCGRAASTQKIQFSNCLDKKHEITYKGIVDHGDYCTPIVYRGITLGVINVELKLDHLKNQIEIDFLNAIANTLAGIIVRKNNEMELKTTLDNLELKVIQRTEEINKKNSELREEIEERISIENELFESEEKFRSLIEDAVDAIFLGDNKGNFIDTNSVSSLLSGYTKDELLKMDMLDLVSEVSKSKFSRFDLLEHGETVHEEQILRRKDKSEIPIEIKTKKMKDGNYQSIIRDISERKRFENELKKMAVVVEQNPVGIVITKPDATVEYVNNHYLTISGYTRDEFIGKKATFLKSGIHDTSFYKELWDTILSGKTWKGIICNKKKSGELYWEQNTISPVIDYNGNISNFIAMKEDVTKLKRTEEELIKSKESAEDANRMKSEFLANMSHEIRTPLNAIVGFSSILKEKTTGQKVFTEYLDNIIQSSSVLLNLINDILDLSKVESGRMVINNQPVNVNSIIHELQSVFIMKAQEKGLSINIKISNNIPGSLITDEKYLRQILFNLIGNAVKFTYKGSVDIIVNIIPKDKKGSKVDILFKVIDTGIGIPSDQLKTIFEPFIQVSQNSRGKYGGTGLGLSITKRLVELMGGTISVESILGHGSVFSVSLFNLEISSLVIDENRNQNNKELLKIKFKNPVILIAEDILSNRQVIKGYLEAFNITIIETENGEECISAIHKQRPDLILMDIQMPVMDGYTAINIIKSDNEWKDIPIIVLTSSGMKQQKDQIQKVADDFLIKPIYKNELLKMLIKYLPYEEQSGINNEQKKLSINNRVDLSKLKLSKKNKEELVVKFLPLITELQDAVNIDELQDFIKKLEKFNTQNKIAAIIDFCNDLTTHVNSFNIEEIRNDLKYFSEIINK